MKHATGLELVAAIRTVLLGRTYLSPIIAAQMGNPCFDNMDKSRRSSSRLTERQREVLQLVAEGKMMKDIAQILNISVRTVEFHKNNLMEQLGIRTTAELTRYALDHKIVV